ncbi:MAG: hypothetical protein WBG13_17030 [Pseudolabrys sp.]
MHVLRILLLVMTAGVLAFILYQAITRQISRDAFWTVIAIACGFSLNLIYLWFAKPGEPPVAIEYKLPVAVEKHLWSIRQTMLVRNPMRSAASGA